MSLTRNHSFHSGSWAKYNSLPACEARRLKRQLQTSGRVPVRTASVMHKPRAPATLMSSLRVDETTPKLSNDDYGFDPRMSSKKTLEESTSGSKYSISSTSTTSSTIRNHIKRILRFIPMGRSSTPDKISYDDRKIDQDSTLTQDNVDGICKSINVTNDSIKAYQSQASTCGNIGNNMHDYFISPADMLKGQGQLNDRFGLPDPQSLQRSQSPPTCPPPTGELLSLSYIDHAASLAMSYSNYDDFTRHRNNKSSVENPSNQLQDSRMSSVLEKHRAANTAFRFSYGQPNAMQFDVPDGFDNDAETTILSDSSTLNGDSNQCKCIELASSLEILKNKLVSKEKELTDSQLREWSRDYHIDKLKSSLSRLEKENARLRAIIAKYEPIN